MAIPTLSVSNNVWYASRDPTSTEPTGTNGNGLPNSAIALFDIWRNTTSGNRFECLDPTPGALVWQIQTHTSGFIAFPSSPIIVGSTSAGTATYSVQVGRYEQIGSQINVLILLNWSGHTGTGNMSIGNLPITPNTTFPCVGMAKLQNISLPALSLMTWAKTNISTGKIDLVASIAGTVDSAISISASGIINLNMVYTP